MTGEVDQNYTIMLAAALLFVLLAAAVLLIAQGSRSRRERARMLAQLRRDGEAQAERVERLSRAVSESARQMAGMSGALEARMDALTRTNDEKLAEMRRTVGEKLDSRLSESFRVVNGQLADVHRGLGEMRELADNVTDLKKVLGNVKTRGVWGEVLLGNVLSQMFSPEQYIENAQIPAGSATRVEFALKLPARDREAVLLPIDSKFPQEDYLRLAEAEASDDTAARERCAKQLERAVMEQAKLISDKYIQPPQTVDFAVMFLPSEGLYAAVARIGGLIERMQGKYRVLISGPSTLCALLTSLQMGFRSYELEKRSGEALALFDELRGEFVHFQEGIARLRQRLGQAEAELDNLENRVRKISKKLM